MKSSSYPADFEPFIELVESHIELATLDASERALLSDPQTLFIAFPYGLGILDESDERLVSHFLELFDYLVKEFRIAARDQPDGRYEKALEGLLLHFADVEITNTMVAFEMVKSLDYHHFAVPDALTSSIAEQSSGQHPVDMSPATIMSMLDDLPFESGTEMALVLSRELSLLPPKGLQMILSQMTSKSETVDTLLLLSLDKSPNVAQAAAEVLDSVSEKQWRHLTHRKLILLAQQFASDAIKPYLARWNKLAMKYAKPQQPQRVESLYASFADGKQAVVFYGLIDGINGPVIFGGVYRLGYGLVDTTYVENATQEYYQGIVSQLGNEVYAEQCDPLLLRYLLSDALHHQKTCPERLSIEGLMMLAMLPNTWTEPQPLTFEKVTKLCDFDIGNKERVDEGRMQSKLLVRSPMIDTWFVEITDDKHTKRNQVRNHYYLQQPDRFVRALTYNALLVHFIQGANLMFAMSNPHTYLAVAEALRQCGGNIGRKTFPLFDMLADKSLAYKARLNAMNSAAQMADEAPSTFQLTIELVGAKPRVWRRFKVSSHLDLESFHHLLQDVMGWEHEHLYMFKTKLGLISHEGESGLDPEVLPLFSVLTNEGESVDYIYDFGDHWQHKVTLEKVTNKELTCPVVTAGRGACPPEDCGGIWGYQDLLDMLRSPTQDDDEQLEWLGIDESWDATAFDKQAVNAVIKQTLEME